MWNRTLSENFGTLALDFLRDPFIYRNADLDHIDAVDLDVDRFDRRTHKGAPTWEWIRRYALDGQISRLDVRGDIDTVRDVVNVFGILIQRQHYRKHSKDLAPGTHSSDDARIDLEIPPPIPEDALPPSVPVPFPRLSLTLEPSMLDWYGPSFLACLAPHVEHLTLRQHHYLPRRFGLIDEPEDIHEAFWDPITSFQLNQAWSNSREIDIGLPLYDFVNLGSPYYGFKFDRDAHVVDEPPPSPILRILSNLAVGSTILGPPRSLTHVTRLVNLQRLTFAVRSANTLGYWFNTIHPDRCEELLPQHWKDAWLSRPGDLTAEPGDSRFNVRHVSEIFRSLYRTYLDRDCNIVLPGDIIYLKNLEELEILCCDDDQDTSVTPGALVIAHALLPPNNINPSDFDVNNAYASCKHVFF